MTADEHTFEELIDGLKSEDDAVLEHTAQELGELGDSRAIQPLIDLIRVQHQRMLEDDQGESIWNAAWDSLVRIGEPAVMPLVTLLQQEYDADIRNEAATALAQIGDKRAIEPMIKLLEDTNEAEVHCGITAALEDFGDKRAIEPLIHVVIRNSSRDGDLEVLEAAARALGTFDDVRGRAAQASANQAIMTIKALNERHSVPRHVTGQPSISYDKLVAALHDKDAAVRQRAAIGLGELGDWRAVDPLLEVLNSDDVDLRYSAAEALGKLGEERAFTALIWLKHKDEGETLEGNKVRDAAARSIERIREANEVS